MLKFQNHIAILKRKCIILNMSVHFK